MSRYIIGVDVGGTNVKLGLVGPRGDIIARSRFDTKAFNRNKKKLIDALVAAIKQLASRRELKKSDILGVGIGMPGFIDPQKGLVLFLPNIPGWHNVPFASILRKKLGLPVFIDNDVNLITLAEWKKGAGRGFRNLVCITLGTGVGGGLILNNTLYRGENFVAGEIGHIPYQDKELELYVGNKVLHERAARIFKRPGIRTQDVFAMAQRGDQRGIKFWYEVGEHIGFVMAGVVNTLNPKRIIIGGGVSNNYKYIAPGIKATIKQKAIKAANNVQIVRARLGDDAGIIGASFLVKDSLLER